MSDLISFAALKHINMATLTDVRLPVTQNFEINK